MKVFRDMTILAAILLGGFWAFTNRPTIYKFIGMQPSDFVKSEQAEPELPVAASPKPETQIKGSAAQIRKAADGHFWTQARVNTTTIKFLVDTGASVVALTPADARKAGFNLNTLSYNAPVNTAGGRVMSAPVKLKSISIGRVSVRNVEAVVIPEGLGQSLLGMSFLGELQKVEASRDSLILRQ